MSQKKIFYLLGATLICCLFVYWFVYQTQDNEKNVIPDSLKKEEESSKEKSKKIKDHFSFFQFSDVCDAADSNAVKMTDAIGNDLVVGGIYLQSKTTGKVFFVSDTLGIFEQLETSLIIDNRECGNIRIKNSDNVYFYVEGLRLLSDEKEVVLDTLGQYELVIDY